MKSPRKTKNGKWLVSGFTLAWLAAMACWGASAQTATPQSQPAVQRSEVQADTPARIVISPSLVVVPVTVKNTSGALVPDLRKDEFRVLEDNVEQKIDFFTVEAFPLSVVVLIDDELKSKDARQVQESLKAIVAGLSPYDEAIICRFDQRFHEGSGFTRDQDRLLTELKRTKLDTDNPSVEAAGGPFNTPTINGQSVTGGPSVSGATVAIKGQPTKTLDDAIYAAAQLLRDKGRDRRKLIFLISDGVNAPKFNANPYEAVIGELQRYNISVFAVGVGNSVFDHKFSRMAKYAEDSGGDIYYAARRQALEELYGRIAEEARHQYTLAYAPRGTNRALDRHSIEVRVAREGLSVHARQSYYSGGVK